MKKILLLLLATAVAPFSTFASTHVWLGTSSNLISDSSNWSGGSPVNDANATLEFPDDAARFDIVNDVSGLPFKVIDFGDDRFTLSGQPLTASNSTVQGSYQGIINCDLVVQGVLTLADYYQVSLRGAISGSGGVLIRNGSASFEGNSANTYVGQTVVDGGSPAGRLILNKSGGSVAVPGNLNINGSVYVFAPEQIADTAEVFVGQQAQTFAIFADETFHALHFASSPRPTTGMPNGDVFVGAYNGPTGLPLPMLTIAAIDVGDFASARFFCNVRYTGDLLRVGRGGGFRLETGKISVESAGLTLPGPGTAAWSGDYTAPTYVNGGLASLAIPRSDVYLTGGRFAGSVAMLSASGGLIADQLISATDVRLAAGVTVNMTPQHPIQLNGTLDLGGATLDLDHFPSWLTGPQLIVQNDSTSSVIGTFAGVPEGGIAQYNGQITYVGGDGNDVATTSLQKPQASVAITSQPTLPYFGEPVTFTVTLTGTQGVPGGTVTFLDALGQIIAASILVNGETSRTFTFATPADLQVSVRYEGDSTYQGGSPELVISSDIKGRTPEITSVDPDAVTLGSTVPVIIHGSGFTPDTSIDSPTALSTTYVSANEVDATLDLTNRIESTILLTMSNPYSGESDPFALVGQQPGPPSPIHFDASSVSATVTPFARTAWLSADLRASPGFLVDGDGDGIVSAPYYSLGPNVVAFVDLSSGHFAAFAKGDTLATVSPIPPHVFARDASGNVTRFVLDASYEQQDRQWQVLWARPGVGAWQMLIGGNAQGGLPGAGVPMFGSVTDMLPMGDSPVHPTGFLSGDVVMMMSNGVLLNGVPVLASTLGSELDDPAAGQLQTLSRDFTFTEDQGFARLPVVRLGGSTGAASVHYHTIARTGFAGRYVPTSGVLNFATGELLQYIEIPLSHNTTFDDSFTTFDVALSDAVGASLGEGTEFVVRIADDQSAPVVDFTAPARITEGNGSSLLKVDLTMTGHTSVPAVVHWTLGTAQGTITVDPSETTKSVLITVPGNSSFDQTEPYYIDFEPVSNVTVARNTLYVTIDDDDRPHVRDRDVVVPENAGNVSVELTLSQTSTSAVTINYETANRTAHAGADYVHTSGTLLFAPGEVRKVISVPVMDNALLDADRSFAILLTSFATSFLEHPEITVAIADDETSSRPALSIADAVTAAATGLGTMHFNVQLSAPSTTEVRARYNTSAGTAVSDVDFQASSGDVVFAPGQTSAAIDVATFGVNALTSSRTFHVTLSAPINATLGTAEATGTLAVGHAALSIEATPSSSTFVPGQPVTYTIRVTNAGPDDAANVIVTDVLPAGAAFVSVTPADACSRSATIVCRFDSLASGATTTILLTVMPSGAAPLTDDASVTSANSSPASANGGVGVTITPAATVTTSVPSLSPELLLLLAALLAGVAVFTLRS